jgi:hypothetical protein
MNESPVASVASDSSSDVDAVMDHSKHKDKHRRTINEESNDEEKIVMRHTKKKKSMNRSHEDHNSIASLRTSPTLTAFLSRDAPDIESRVATLEKEIAIIKNQLARITPKGKQFKGAVFQLERYQVANIGNFVRSEMFKAIKFVDATTLRSQGNIIFQRALKAAKVDGQEDNQEVFNIIISKVKHYLNIRKGHVIHDFRAAALGEYLLEDGISLYCQIFNSHLLFFIFHKFNTIRLVVTHIRCTGLITLNVFALMISIFMVKMSKMHGLFFASSCFLKLLRHGKTQLIEAISWSHRFALFLMKLSQWLLD